MKKQFTFSALAFLALNVSPALSATLSRSVDVNAPPAAVWSMIGPWCAIKDWLPPVGSCTEKAGPPRERTLVTKDGKATFIERETARNEADHSYSYAFKSTPLPVTGYEATIKVIAKGPIMSTVTWSSTYMPNAGKEQDAQKALTEIYDAGLSTIKAKFTK
jgi:polyketide cyclase/dehydrase/lipid transport protein